MSFTFLALWQSNKAFHLSNPVKPFQNLIILDFSGPSDIVNNPSFLKHSSPLALSLRPLRHTFFLLIFLFLPQPFFPFHTPLLISLIFRSRSLSISMALTYNLHASDVQTFISVLNSSPLYPMPILKNSI